MIKFKICNNCQEGNCLWFLKDAFDGDSWCCYEPDDYDGDDIASANVKEMRLQNGDF